MRRSAFIVILVLLAATAIARAAPPPTFTARWDGPGRATVAWSQPPNIHLTCLYRDPADASPILVRCWLWLPPGGYGVLLGSEAPVDGNLRPQGGDEYVLTHDEQVSRAPLRSVSYLPVAR